MLPAKHEKVGIVGGSRDGAKVAVVDPSQCALVLVVQEVDGQWVTDMRSRPASRRHITDPVKLEDVVEYAPRRAREGAR